MSLVNSDLLPAQGGVILPLIGRHETVRKDREDSLRALHKDFRVLEDRLQKNRYLVGEQLTLADFFAVGMLMFSFMIFHKMLSVDYPRLTEWFHKVYEVPMFKEVAGELRLLDVPAPTLPEQEQ